MSNNTHADDYEHIEVRKIGGNIGAEVGGVVADGELRRRLSASSAERCCATE